MPIIVLKSALSLSTTEMNRIWFVRERGSPNLFLPPLHELHCLPPRNWALLNVVSEALAIPADNLSVFFRSHLQVTIGKIVFYGAILRFSNFYDVLSYPRPRSLNHR